MALASFTSVHDRVNKFKETADKICHIADRYSVSIRGYHSPELHLYNALSDENQIRALEQLQVFLKSIEMTESAGATLDNQERSLWGALSTLGLIHPSELFSKFKPDDVIEIYDLQGIQIWRNFNFMRICSYTLEEVYSIEWHRRYKRDPEKVRECEIKVGNLLSGKTPPIYFVEVSEHIVEETLSCERLVLSLRHDWIARLKDSSGGLAGWIVVSGVRILGRSQVASRKSVLHLVPPAAQYSV